LAAADFFISRFFEKKIAPRVCARICHLGGGLYLFVSRVFNPLDYSYGGATAASAKGEVARGRRLEGR